MLEGSAIVGEQPAAAAAVPCLFVAILLLALIMTLHIRQDVAEAAPTCPGSGRLHACVLLSQLRFCMHLGQSFHA